MAVKLSDLTTESAPASTDILAIADPTTGVMRKITVQALKDYMDTLSGLTPLSTPTLTATVISSTQIDLSWTNVANESSYRLEWSPNGSSGWTQIGGTIAANTTTYSHTSLTPSTLYYYRVKAVGDGVTYSDSGYGTDSDTTSAGGGIDADAQAYITASGRTGQDAAFDTFYAGLKADGLYTKIYAGWIFKGGDSATKQKFNFKNPLDNNGAHRITFSGTPTHSASGLQGDGSTAVGDLNFNPASVIGDGNGATVCFAVNAGSGGGGYDFGGFETGQKQLFLTASENGTETKGAVGNVAVGSAYTFTAPFSNLYDKPIIISRESATSQKLYEDNVLKVTSTTSISIVYPGINMFVMAYNNNGSNFGYSTSRLTHLIIAQGLNATEVGNLNSRVKTLMSAL
jgi:hypothetical protein